MAINRYYKSEPVQFNFGQVPLQPLMMAMESKQKRYDQGLAASEELYNVSLESLKQDRARADELVQGWRGGIDSAVEKYKGDYSQIMGDLYRIKRDITRSVGPGGEAGAIVGNYKSYIKSLEEERERLKKGEITQQQLEAWNESTLSGYTGVGQKDPVTGMYNQLMPESIAKYTDPNDLMHTALKSLAAEEGGSEITQIGNKWMTKVKGEWKELSAERIQKATGMALAGSPEYVNYVQQLARFRGQDPSTALMADVVSRAQLFGEAYAYKNVKTGLDYEANPWSMLYARLKAERENTQILANTYAGPLVQTPFQNVGDIVQRVGSTVAMKTTDNPFVAAGLSAINPIIGAVNAIKKLVNMQSAITTDPLGTSPTVGKTMLNVLSSIITGRNLMEGDDLMQAMKALPTSPPDYDETVVRSGNMIAQKAPALMPMWDNVVKQIDAQAATSGWSEQQRKAALAATWAQATEQLQTWNPTNIDLTLGPLGDSVAKVWDRWAHTGSWAEIRPDGTTKVLNKPPKGFDVKEHKAVGIHVGPNLGLHAKVNGVDYVVTNTGLHDKTLDAFRPLQQLTSVFYSGVPGETLYNDPSKGASYLLRGILDENGLFRVELRNPNVTSQIIGTLSPQESKSFIDGGIQSGFQQFAPLGYGRQLLYPNK